MNSESLTALEVAAGLVLARPPGAPRPRAETQLPIAPQSTRDREALAQDLWLESRRAMERQILPALLRPPCLVSFSGGRDSAAVLAVAASLARHEGLPAPVPATNVFRSAPAADETEWQCAVIRHLGLTDWLRIEHDDELDLIGPYAQRVLRGHGLLWPPNVHFHVPLLDAAQGGSLLTGIGGDELFTAARRGPHAAIFTAAGLPHPRHLVTLSVAFAPRGVRRRLIARRHPVDVPWLRPTARALATEAVAAEAAAEPRTLRQRMAWWRCRRYLRIGVDAVARTADDADVLILHPLLSPEYWAVVARLAAPHGFSGRTAGMRRLFGDLLPPEVVARTDKAHFDEAFWCEHSQTFARRWNGTGVPEEWVDAGVLAQHWRAGRPSAQSFTLVQAAWLNSDANRTQEAADCAVH